MPKHLYRCQIPGTVRRPAGSVNKTEYPARLAKEPNSVEDDEVLLSEDKVPVLRQNLRLPINPNYTIGVDWLVKLSGETEWSKIVLVRELFIQERPRFWLITRELQG